MALLVLGFRTSSYARSIYLLGTLGFSGIPAEYVIPVKQYAAANYTLADINAALASGWITQQEYDDTISYISV